MDRPAIKQRQNTMYDQMEFPPYEYNEFPMAVPVVDGVVQPTPYDARRRPHPVVIVDNQDQLDELRGPAVVLVKVNEAAPDSPQRIESEADIREVLYRQAEQAGVTIDKRWTVARIESTLQAAAAEKDTVV